MWGVGPTQNDSFMLRPLPWIDFGRCAHLPCNSHLLKNEQRFLTKANISIVACRHVDNDRTTGNPLSQLS
jgi:hypothetical protein